MSSSADNLTSFTNQNDGDFESAGEASRKLQEYLAAKQDAAERAAKRAERQAARRAVNLPTNPFTNPAVSSSAFIPSRSSDSSYAIDSSLLQEVKTAQLSHEFNQTQDISEEDMRWAWTNIDVSSLKQNTLEMKRQLKPQTRLAAVLAADAYGHGAVMCAKTFTAAGADFLAVSSVKEGKQLREAGITHPILLLSQAPRESIPLLIEHRLTPSIYESDFAVLYGEAADLSGMSAPYHLAINTGMNRLGVHFSEAVEFLRHVSFHRALQLEGVFTHFATSQSKESLDLKVATSRFDDALRSIRAAGFNPQIVHAANSAAACLYPETHYDMVRCGAALYGLHPCDATRTRLELQPAMSVHARISDVRLVPVSEGVSYGYRYRSPGSVKICTIPLGYADGLPSKLSGKIDVITQGASHPQVGKICMNETMFEINLRQRQNRSCNPCTGDHVLIMGEEAGLQITAEELSKKAEADVREITTGFGQRLARLY